MKEQTASLGGFSAKERTKSYNIDAPRLDLFESILKGSGERSDFPNNDVR